MGSLNKKRSTFQLRDGVYNHLHAQINHITRNNQTTCQDYLHAISANKRNHSNVMLVTCSKFHEKLEKYRIFNIVNFVR